MKQLYRSADDKKIAGVCSGLGAYFDIDPVFFRVFFLVLACIGGIGFVAYAASWALVPVEGVHRETRFPIQLRLSVKDRKIAGVCGGLGEFLDVDPVLFRVTFVVLSFVGGIGVFLYVALWLIVPKAPETSSPDDRSDGGRMTPTVP